MVRSGRSSLRGASNIHRPLRIGRLRKFDQRRRLPLRRHNVNKINEVHQVRVPQDGVELPGHSPQNDTLACSNRAIDAAGEPGEHKLCSDCLETEQSLACSLQSVLVSFFQSRAGGQMSESGTTTTINRICQFIEWAHRQLHNDQPPSNDLIVSPRRILEWFMEAISTNPHILEEYIGYQFTTIQRSPSTIINHMDALLQCYNFIVYDGRLADGGTSPIEVNAQFTTRFPFFNKRCRRTLRKQLKKHK